MKSTVSYLPMRDDLSIADSCRLNVINLIGRNAIQLDAAGRSHHHTIAPPRHLAVPNQMMGKQKSEMGYHWAVESGESPRLASKWNCENRLGVPSSSQPSDVRCRVWAPFCIQCSYVHLIVNASIMLRKGTAPLVKFHKGHRNRSDCAIERDALPPGREEVLWERVYTLHYRNWISQ